MARRQTTGPRAVPPEPVESITGPARMCVGCRGRASRAALLRVVVDADQSGPVSVLIPDPRRTLSGRGASVHPDPGCVDAAERRRAFTRALRVDGPVDLTLLRAYLSRGVAGHPPASSQEPST